MVESQICLHNNDRHLAFRAVNRRSSPGYCKGFQKHHLIPVNMRRYREFGALLSIASVRLGY
jgi:hypothetical protein